LIPNFTGYNVSLANQNGSNISGFPQKWYLSGGASGTVNLSSGTPLYAGVVFYPQAIVTPPAVQGLQSINGALAITGNETVGGTLAVAGMTNSGDYVNTALATMKWGSSGTSTPDTGLSRSAAGTVAVGNGIQGDKTGILLLSKLAAGGTAATGSVAGDITAARASTQGAYFLGTDGGQLFRNGNSFQLIGAW
jgi:hypothetical protein